VKAILTGPMTMMNWSFVRNDLPTNVVSRQLALALSDEVNDLQNNGIKIIQIDEAAFKEGYPLRKENISDYETMAIKGFKYTVFTAKKETQIHTHMCYSEFRDIIKTIEAMDADVISIETVRSGNKLLEKQSGTVLFATSRLPISACFTG
jgi:5-methyltetrahydropteroyltriglutamate--homocysteine methyltransferase